MSVCVAEDLSNIIYWLYYFIVSYIKYLYVYEIMIKYKL